MEMAVDDQPDEICDFFAFTGMQLEVVYGNGGNGIPGIRNQKQTAKHDCFIMDVEVITLG
jgi:hypothetical protein